MSNIHVKSVSLQFIRLLFGDLDIWVLVIVESHDMVKFDLRVLILLMKGKQQDPGGTPEQLFQLAKLKHPCFQLAPLY